MRAIGSHHSAAMKSDVYLTPPEIIDALGPFDLDPCAAPEPRPWPTAKRHICLPENGLLADWGEAFVWLNPLYSREAGRWVSRLAEHPGGGIALVFARTETEWFVKSVWKAKRATAVFFIHGRITFRDRFGEPVQVEVRVPGKDKVRFQTANAGAPSVLVAYGREAAARLLGSNISGTFLPVGRNDA